MSEIDSNAATIPTASDAAEPGQYFHSQASRTVWTVGAFSVLFVVIGGSFSVGSVGFGAIMVTVILAGWYGGYWVLSKNVYYVAAGKVGYRDAFGGCEVDLSVVKSVTYTIQGRSGYGLIFETAGDPIRLLVGLYNEPWLAAVREEVRKRNIPYSAPLPKPLY